MWKTQKSVIDLLKIFYTIDIGGLAQLVEQLTLNQRVGGSNPPASTRFRSPGSEKRRGFFFQSKQLMPVWWASRELNPDPLRDRILSPARLPIPPLALVSLQEF